MGGAGARPNKATTRSRNHSSTSSTTPRRKIFPLRLQKLVTYICMLLSLRIVFVYRSNMVCFCTPVVGRASLSFFFSFFFSLVQGLPCLTCLMGAGMCTDLHISSAVSLRRAAHPGPEEEQRTYNEPRADFEELIHGVRRMAGVHDF